MQHEAVLQTVKAIGVAGMGLVASGTGLLIQLKTPHKFMSLELPYWFFLVSTVILTMFGALLSLKNDYMRDQGTPVANFFLALIVGLVISFVLLPVAVAEPSVGLLQASGFVGGLFGTIALRIIIDLTNDDELRDAVKSTLKAIVMQWLERLRKVSAAEWLEFVKKIWRGQK